MSFLAGAVAASRSPTTAALWDCHVHVFDAAAPVKPGHYTPPTHALADIEARAAAHGVGHLVLVQPSVYGSDNTVLLQTLQRSAGAHRGVVVVGADVALSDLEAMHRVGVRGVRFNLVSPVGEQGWPQRALARLAPHLKALGWHAQWYAQPKHLPTIALWQNSSGVPCVLDHLAGMHAGIAADDKAWTALQTLAQGGAWVKLSAWYRLRSAAPHSDLIPVVQRLHQLFGDHLVWGSDWPHTSIVRTDWPAYNDLWAPVVASLGAAAWAARSSAPAALYA